MRQLLTILEKLNDRGLRNVSSSLKVVRYLSKSVDVVNSIRQIYAKYRLPIGTTAGFEIINRSIYPLATISSSPVYSFGEEADLKARTVQGRRSACSTVPRSNHTYRPRARTCPGLEVKIAIASSVPHYELMVRPGYSSKSRVRADGTVEPISSDVQMGPKNRADRMTPS